MRENKPLWSSNSSKHSSISVYHFWGALHIKKSYGFGTTWGWVNNFYFWINNPSKTVDYPWAYFKSHTLCQSSNCYLIEWDCYPKQKLILGLSWSWILCWRLTVREITDYQFNSVLFITCVSLLCIFYLESFINNKNVNQTGLFNLFFCCEN